MRYLLPRISHTLIKNIKNNNNNLQQIRTITTINNKMARILQPNEENMKEAAELIKSGGLVSFPTETVYGLGANALDENAVLKIFHSKGRPLTDPVIVHIADAGDALPLLDLSESLKNIFKILSSQFWPGPLTIVAKASSKIPSMVTAHTGFVGVRHPRHPVAQELIRKAQLPIAAPSANRFGHVSPTSAEHVFADLGAHPIIIVDGGQTACGVGIESTVAKLVEANGESYVEVLRRGGVSTQALTSCLTPHGINLRVLERKAIANNTTEGMEAPGQLLTHYAPDKPAYITNFAKNGEITSSSSGSSFDISKSVLIDFGGKLIDLKDKCFAYRDLSPAGDVAEAANLLFSFLRWSEGESVGEALLVLLPDLRGEEGEEGEALLENSDAVFDRIFRAASGRTAIVDKATQKNIYLTN